MPHVTTKDIKEKFNLSLVSGEEGIGRHVAISDISRPGIEMAGYFTHYPSNRIQLMGKTEISFFALLTAKEKSETNDEIMCIGYTSYYRFTWNGSTRRINCCFK